MADTSDIEIALAEIGALKGSLNRLEISLKDLLKAGQQQRLTSLPACDVPVTEHRREHRPGVPGIIASNPDLQAFILARLDRLTFKQIADDIARHFPVPLHVHQSTIHRWAQKQSRTNPRWPATISDKRKTSVGLRRSNSRIIGYTPE